MHGFVHRKKKKNDYFSRGNYGVPDVFDIVAIETTDECTRRCSYCPLSQGNTRNYLPEEVVMKVLTELKFKKYKGAFCFSNYGEPCLDNRLLLFINLTRMLFPDAFINMSTNGDLLTPELFRALIKVGINEIDITQHGAVEPTNHRKLKEELTKEEKKKIIWVKLDENSILSNRGGTVKVNSKRIPKKICYQSTLIIRANGTVTLCCHDYFGEITLGDAKTENVFDIWFKPENVQIREELYNGIAKKYICKKCYLFQNE